MTERRFSAIERRFDRFCGTTIPARILRFQVLRGWWMIDFEPRQFDGIAVQDEFPMIRYAGSS